MKAVILAGGFGTRISEESALKPKPMIEIGGKPILWHIMKIYASHGIDHFIVCLGYKGYLIKEYFANYFLHQSDVTIDLAGNRLEVHQNSSEAWKITLIDTGERTMTGGRLKRIAPYVAGDEAFCMTYGDGVGDVDVAAVIARHRAAGRMATMTVTQPPGRFGALSLDGDEHVTAFHEKPPGDSSWINAGFFVLSPRVLERIAGDDVAWERQPMEALAAENQLTAYLHRGFWQPMDTLRDRTLLEDLWASGRAPWKRW